MLVKQAMTLPQLTIEEVERRQPRLTKIASQYRGCVKGTPTPGATVPANTPLADCQRDLALNNLIKYIDKVGGLDWNLFGLLTVARYADGTLAIIDGQHKTLIARLIVPEIEQLPAQIIDVPAGSEAYAPMIFAHRNGVLTKPASQEDNFWALFLAKDTEALYYADWLKQANLSCGKVNRADGVKRNETKYPTFKKCVDRSGPCTVLAAELLTDVFDDRWIDNVFHGLVTLFTIDEEFQSQFEDENSKLRKDFEHWFRTAIRQVWSVSDLRFTQYRNAAKWEYGVAWGIWRAFTIYCKNTKNHTKYKTGVVQEAYRAQIKDKTPEYTMA